MKIIAFIIFLYYSNFALAAVQPIVRDGKTLWLNSEISKNIANSLNKHILSGIKTIVVNSIGGDAEAGLMIAKAVSERKITVVVDKYCFSSCANYLFLAGHRKVLSQGAVLGFHGGLHSPEANQNKFENSRYENDLEAVRKLLYEDESFFRALRFNRDFFKLSFDLTKPINQETSFIIKSESEERLFPTINEASQYILELQRKEIKFEIVVHSSAISQRKFYFPSEHTLKKFGAYGIVNYPYPKNKKQIKVIQGKLLKLFGSEFEIVADIKGD